MVQKERVEAKNDMMLAATFQAWQAYLIAPNRKRKPMEWGTYKSHFGFGDKAKLDKSELEEARESARRIQERLKRGA
jgi:hypothetical protein